MLHRGNFHPYEIKRRLLNAMVQCYSSIDVGTLYYAIGQLAKAHLITAVSREHVARGGARTVYAITALGRERFQRLLHDCFAAEGPVSDTMYGALLFLHLGNLQRIADSFEMRIKQQAEAIRKVGEVRRQLAPFLSSGALHLLDHLDAQRRLDQNWLQSVRKEVVAGNVHDVPDTRRLGITDDDSPVKARKIKRRTR